MKKFIFFFVFSALITGCTKNQPGMENWREPATVGAKGEEATLRYTGMVEMIQKKQPTAAEVREQIDFQIQHLFGPMELGDKLGTQRAAPKDKYTFKVKSTEKKPNVPETWVATYDYEGEIVVEKGSANTYEVYLPINPDTIFAQSKEGVKPNEKGKVVSPCCFQTWPSKTEFWYFWSPAPAYPECKLKQGEHYQKITGTLERHHPRYKTTYPDYPRLVENGEINIHLIFGKDDYKHGRSPFGSVDDSAKNFLVVRKMIEDLGFKIRVWDLAEINNVLKAEALKDAPYIEEAIKDYGAGRPKVRVRMFYGQTELEYKDRLGFHFFLRDAVEHAAILMYDGHSGLGKSSNLKTIEDTDSSIHFKFTINKEKYQIFFFNSCSSFAYYNAQYFRRKRSKDADGTYKGMHNLDMISNGLSTDWKPEPDFALVKAVDTYVGKNIWTSYQDLAEEFDTGNLNVIEGDEDNPRNPR